MAAFLAPSAKEAVGAGRPDSEPALIECIDMSAGYGSVSVLSNVNMLVRPGEVVAVLGANGAGKTTALLALAGEVPLASGHVRMDGRATSEPLHKRAQRGMRVITEDRAVFMSLSVADNLRLVHKDLAEPLRLFPELEPLLRRRVGLLSGGEQQILTLARALTGGTRLLLVDELSLGLAPLVVRRLFAAVREAANRGMGVLLVEQQIRNALLVADRAYVFRHGRVSLEGTSDELRDRISDIESAYLT